MKENKNVWNKHIITALTIITLVIGSIWVFERYENDIIERKMKKEHQKTLEENELLKLEVETLTKELEFIKEKN